MGTLYTGGAPDRRYYGSTGRRGGGMRPSDGSSPHWHRQAAAFDALAGYYDEVYRHKSGQIIATQWLADRLPPGARVLDLGCGTGEPTAAMLTDTGQQVLGIDVSTAMLDRARHAVPAATFLQQDMLELDGSLGVFDAAAVFHSLSMLPRAHIPGVLGSLRACCGPAPRSRSGWLKATSTTARSPCWTSRST